MSCPHRWVASVATILNRIRARRHAGRALANLAPRDLELSRRHGRRTFVSTALSAAPPVRAPRAHPTLCGGGNRLHQRAHEHMSFPLHAVSCSNSRPVLRVVRRLLPSPIVWQSYGSSSKRRRVASAKALQALLLGDSELGFSAITLAPDSSASNVREAWRLGGVRGPRSPAAPSPSGRRRGAARRAARWLSRNRLPRRPPRSRQSPTPRTSPAPPASRSPSRAARAAPVPWVATARHRRRHRPGRSRVEERPTMSLLRGDCNSRSRHCRCL